MPFQQPIPIVIRSHNDLAYLRQTLDMVERQSLPVDIHVYDNASTDGSAVFLASRKVVVHEVPAGTYVPGKVLNRAMAEVDTQAPFVVFLNSDCTPVDEHWLAELVNGFADPKVAAVFGRQSPRPDCKPLFAKDTDDTFGDGSRQQYWRHCFSMASSAIRRSVWETLPFRTDIQYSEDIDWTWRIRQLGWTISYRKDSRVLHSHNYTVREFSKRHFGEGKAEATIFDWSRWDRSLLRYSLLPYLRQVKSDLVYAIKTKNLSIVFQSPLLRGAQMVGRRKGFKAGWAGRETP